MNISLSLVKYHLNKFETSPISSVNELWLPGVLRVFPPLSHYFITSSIHCVFLHLTTTISIVIYLFLELCIISRTTRMLIFSHFHSYYRLVIYFHSAFSLSLVVVKKSSVKTSSLGRVISKFLFHFTYYSKSSQRPIL